MNKKNILEVFQIIAILVVIVIMLIPIVWIVLAAFKNQVDLYQIKFIFSPTLDNFREIFNSTYAIHKKFTNSAIVSTITVLLTIPISCLSAYSFSRFKIFAGKYLFLISLFTQFIPAIIIVLPFFILFRDLNLLDTKISLIIINLALTMPFAIWMLKNFIDTIPLDVEEAAMIDGSNRFQVIKDIVFPMIRPGIITTAIFCFIISWNEFIFALILTSKDSVTLPVGLSLFEGEEGIIWNLVSASGILIMIPMFVFSLIIQKHLIKGMSAGAIK